MLSKSEFEVILREVSKGNSLGIRMMDGNLPFDEPVNAYLVKVSRVVGDGVGDRVTEDKIVLRALETLSPYLS